MNRRAKRKLKNARHHQRQQADKKQHALLAASRFTTEKDRRKVMQEWGYVPNGKGGWRSIDTRNQQKRVP